jgi:hypothetical protein
MMPAYEAPQTNKPIKRPFRWGRAILAILSIAIAFALCAGAVSAFTGDAGKSTVNPPSSNAKAGPAPMAHPTQGAKPKVATSVGNGMFKVGTDVAPGTYKTSGATGGAVQLCYWDIRTSTGDEDIVLGSQGTVTGTADPGMVTLKKGTYFKSQGCEKWSKQ